MSPSGTNPVGFPLHTVATPHGGNPTRHPFVLVHGGRHGGWCWDRVAPLLRQAGHEVYAPTMTGLGERSHLLHPDIGLDVHIEDLVGLFDHQEISDAVLVAHSYGGMVAAGAMERIAEQVHTLVFLDAYMPLTGESMLQLVEPQIAELTMALAESEGQGWYIPPTDGSAWGLSDPMDLAWVNRRVTAHPLKSYRDHVGSTERAWAHPGTYIECASGHGIHVPVSRPTQRAASDPNFGYRVLDAPHDAMVAAPHQLATLLLELSEE